MLDMFTTIINFDQSVRSENTLAGLKIVRSEGRIGRRRKGRAERHGYKRGDKLLKDIKEKVPLTKKLYNGICVYH